MDANFKYVSGRSVRARELVAGLREAADLRRTGVLGWNAKRRGADLVVTLGIGFAPGKDGGIDEARAVAVGVAVDQVRIVRAEC